MYSNKPILCVDFDGVIHSYKRGWKGPRNIPDLPVPGSLKFLVDALDSFEVNVYSSRSRYWFARAAMKEWLRKEYCRLGRYKDTPQWFTNLVTTKGSKTLWLDRIKEVSNEIVSSIKFPVKKPAASILLDDRAITFRGKFPTIESLQAFKPWNKGGTYKQNRLQADFDIAIKALREIKNEQGRVCDGFELCKHTSCQSSVASWFIANKALEATVGIDENKGDGDNDTQG